MVTIKSLRSRAKIISAGSFTIFMKIGKIGIKLFLNQENRDYAFRAQQLAHSSGIGPRAIKTFQFYDPETSSNWYCYTTEVVKTLPCKTLTNAVIEKLSELIDDLALKMSNAGLDPWDLRRKNVGIVKGRLVCIDFGGIGIGKPLPCQGYKRKMLGLEFVD